MREYVEELSDRSLNLEECMDGDKFDQRGKFTDEDFEPFVNNINFGQGLLSWLFLKKSNNEPETLKNRLR